MTSWKGVQQTLTAPRETTGEESCKQSCKQNNLQIGWPPQIISISCPPFEWNSSFPRSFWGLPKHIDLRTFALLGFTKSRVQLLLRSSEDLHYRSLVRISSPLSKVEFAALERDLISLCARNNFGAPFPSARRYNAQLPTWWESQMNLFFQFIYKSLNNIQYKVITS